MSDDTEKMLEEYKQEVADSEKADYEALTPDEKTAWLRCGCQRYVKCTCQLVPSSCMHMSARGVCHAACIMTASGVACRASRVCGLGGAGTMGA